jgi:hypothetical protein
MIQQMAGSARPLSGCPSRQWWHRVIVCRMGDPSPVNVAQSAERSTSITINVVAQSATPVARWANIVRLLPPAGVCTGLNRPVLREPSEALPLKLHPIFWIQKSFLSNPFLLRQYSAPQGRKVRQCPQSRREIGFHDRSKAIRSGISNTPTGKKPAYFADVRLLVRSIDLAREAKRLHVRANAI